MFCPNCGKEVPDGSRFCGHCGFNLSEYQSNDKAAPPDRHNPFPVKQVGIAVAAAAVIVAVVFGVQALLSTIGNSSNAYVYLSDGNYELITDLSKGDIIEIASSRSDDTYAGLVSFSPDGKYVYYYTRYDSSSETGTLCRAEYGKLKADSSKNDSYIETIASNVSRWFQCMDDETILYKNGDGALYYYDGSDVTRLAKSVKTYYTDGTERVVYSTGTYDEGYTLYGVYVTDPDSKVKLASNYAHIYVIDDFDNIYYTKEDDENNETLYVVGFDKDAEQLGKNVDVLEADAGALYFTAENGETISLYDYVDDTYASADAGITEPNLDDFTIPEYSYEMIYGSDLSESDYDELYTSCTKALYWYGENRLLSYSMYESLDITWSTNSDATNAATQDFIDQFADSANEDGYILVTDEVKAALQEIQRSYSDDTEDEWMWLWLCYSRYQSGTTIDDAYYAAYDAYEEAADRISIREMLQDSENDYALKTLYCCENGTLTTVAENVLSTKCYTGAILYNTADMVTETINMNMVDSTSDVTDLFSLDYSAENNLLCYGSTAPVQVSSSAAEDISDFYYDNGSVYFYVVGSSIYMTCSGVADIYYATIDNGTVDKFSFVSDEAYMLISDSEAYYECNFYLSNDHYYIDLYQCVDGESEVLARDIMEGDFAIYDDGIILAYTDYNSYGYELTMFDAEGEKTVIADDVGFSLRSAEGNVLYISDGNLYSYDEGERTLIGRDVDWLWMLNTMEANITYDY